MKRLLWAIVISLPAITTLAQTEHMHPPGASDDCSTLPATFQVIVAAMEAPGATVQVAEQRGQAPAVEPGMKRLELVLQPMSAVQAVAGKVRAGENPDGVFGGFIRFRTPADGLYRISVDSTVWLDVLDGDQPRERARDILGSTAARSRRVSALRWQAIIRTGLSCRQVNAARSH